MLAVLLVPGEVAMGPRERGAPPADVKRALRQEAGFGCCRCGYPFYQYHHIVPWNQEEHYRPDDMMIICPNCHDEVTNGRVSEQEHRRWKADPVNIRDGYASGRLRIDQKELVVNLGGNRFVETPVLLQLNDDDMIKMGHSEDGRLLVSMRSYDENDGLLFHVQDNEWETGAHLPWDLEAKWRHVVLRHRSRDIGLEIDARQDPVKVRGTFWKLRQRFKVTENELIDQLGNHWVGCDASHCDVGMSFRIP